MDDEEAEVDLREGMQVASEDGDQLGTLAALLVEDDEEEAEFILVKSGEDERLIPFDAVLGVGDGALVLDVTREVLDRYPLVKPGTDPTDDDLERAYDAYDETGTYVEEE